MGKKTSSLVPVDAPASELAAESAARPTMVPAGKENKWPTPELENAPAAESTAPLSGPAPEPARPAAAAQRTKKRSVDESGGYRKMIKKAPPPTRTK